MKVDGFYRSDCCTPHKRDTGIIVKQYLLCCMLQLILTEQVVLGHTKLPQKSHVKRLAVLQTVTMHKVHAATLLQRPQCERHYTAGGFSVI